MSSTIQTKPIVNAKSKSSTGNSNGRLIATILSAYDLVEDEPLSVQMETLGQTLETGPPVARHKDKNAFRFVGSNNKEENFSSPSDLIINAPLPSLYSANLKFTVVLSKSKLVSTCKISNIVRVNEAQWLILALSDSNENKDDETATSTADPTLRIKIRLEGPYRQEISAIISACNTWFHTVDHLSTACGSTFQSLTVDLPSKFPAAKLFLVPAVPLVAVFVALLPLITGLLVVGLPLFLPVLVIVAILATLLGVIGTGLYFSTKQGRIQLQDTLAPAFSTFTSTSVGQRFLYDTGPRPSPKHIVQLVMPTSMSSKLFMSLLLDFIGSASYLIPGVGEITDIGWAPLQSLCIAVMYDETMPSLKYISFVEEILPFTDLFPSATVGWLRQYSPLLLDLGKRTVMDMSIVLNREKAGVDDFMRKH